MKFFKPESLNPYLLGAVTLGMNFVGALAQNSTLSPTESNAEPVWDGRRIGTVTATAVFMCCCCCAISSMINKCRAQSKLNKLQNSKNQILLENPEERAAKISKAKKDVEDAQKCVDATTCCFKAYGP